jgi:hypothetical protein
MASTPIRVSRFEKSAAASAGGPEQTDSSKKTPPGESYLLNKLSVVADNMETYQGRDTLITFMHYIALVLADICCFFRIGRKAGKRMSERFVNAFVQLSNCRVMLRLLDDFGAIRDFYRFYKDENAKVFTFEAPSFNLPVPRNLNLSLTEIKIINPSSMMIQLI